MEKKTSDFSLGRIIIVDDEQELMTVLCETLAGKGYETLGFTSGEKALDTLKSQDFDILLTDLMMPGMDGIALLKAALEIDHNIISILMTGQGTVQTAVEAIQSGAFDYILKPFKINFLLPLVYRAMEMRRLKLDNIQLQETLAVHELATMIAFPFDIRTILNKLLDAALQQCQADESSIMLPEEDGKSELYVAVAKGKHLEQFIGTRVSVEGGIAGWVARNHQLVTLDGKVEDARFKPVNPRDDIHSAASMPILAGGKLLGVLNVSTTQSRRAFTLGQIKGLSILVSIVAPVLESSWLYDQIRQAEEKYRSIFTNSIEGIVQSSPEGRFITANPALARMYGYDSQEELIATVKSIAEELYIRSEEWDAFKHLLHEKGLVKNFEAEMRRKDRTTFWASMNARVIRNKNGEILYYEGTVEDITRRKEAEDILKMYTLLSENTRDIILFVRLRDGSIMEANQAAEDAYGYTREKLQSMTISELRESGSLVVVTEDIKRSSKEGLLYETVHRRKDGTTFFVECSSRGIVVKDEEVFINVIRNITERKKAEEKIVAEKQRFLSLVDNAPFGMIMVNQEGNFQYYNPKFEEMFGYTLYDTPNGKTWVKKAYPDPAYRHSVISTWKADIEKVKDGGQTSNVFEVTCKDGSIKVVNFIPVQMESGQLLVACNDITSRIEAEEALKESFEKLQKATGAIIDVIVMAVEMKDPYTSGHQKRVANLAMAIATDMGLPSDLRQGIHIAGMIHDLGKISIPAEILSMPRKLNDIEFSLIKVHPQTGYDMLKDIDFDWPIAQMVYQHHEMLDGSGYPNGLKGEAILLEAKILAVADVVEAMASHRPYRAALGLDVALKEIEDNAGILYDSNAVDACVRLFREKGFAFE